LGFFVSEFSAEGFFSSTMEDEDEDAKECLVLDGEIQDVAELDVFETGDVIPVITFQGRSGPGVQYVIGVDAARLVNREIFNFYRTYHCRSIKT